MADNTLTRMDLADAVHSQVGLSRNESADLVESVLNHVSDALVSGEAVKVSSFGTFSVREKAARVGRNPRTGETVQVGVKNAPYFKTGKELRERLNDGVE